MSGFGSETAAAAAVFAAIASPAAGSYRDLKKIALPITGAADTGGAILSWANPEGVTIIIESVVIDITTQSAGACTADFGIAAGATTSSDNFIDGASLAATGLLNNIEDKGSNGKSRQRMTSGQFLTGSRASGASAGLVGTAYVTYYVA